MGIEIEIEKARLARDIATSEAISAILKGVGRIVTDLGRLEGKVDELQGHIRRILPESIPAQDDEWVEREARRSMGVVSQDGESKNQDRMEKTSPDHSGQDS